MERTAKYIGWCVLIVALLSFTQCYNRGICSAYGNGEGDSQFRTEAHRQFEKYARKAKRKRKKTGKEKEFRKNRSYRKMLDF